VSSEGGSRIPDDDMRFAIRVADRERIAQRQPSIAQRRRQAPPETGVGTLDRALDVLDAVEAGARSFTDIVRATGLTRPTAHRMIRALEAHGLLMHVGGHGFALGTRLLRLAESASRNLPLRDLAHPALERLARATGESAQLYVRDGHARLCVDSVESESELRTIVNVGASLPLTRGSAGKVFLAWAGGPDVATVTADLDRDARDRLLRQLATTKRRGWADSIGEREEGVASVSGPVFDVHGALTAVVSVSGPANRIGQLRGRHYAPAVTAAAREVAAAMDSPHSGPFP
jgi:DNA-binding IclR family transcriptional regulator